MRDGGRREGWGGGVELNADREKGRGDKKKKKGQGGGDEGREKKKKEEKEKKKKKKKKKKEELEKLRETNKQNCRLQESNRRKNNN